jgi:Exopolyphosphatase
MNNSLPKSNIFAAVDIGSYSTKMKIAEAFQDGSVNTLESPKRYMNLGKDTFTTGKIRHEQVEDICNILKNFKKLMNEYGAEKHMIVSTSALREAVNCYYILDYIYQKTGLKIAIISESEERFYTYSAIADRLKIFSELKQEGLLITDIGAGGVEITLFLEGDLVFTQYIKMGSLRLKEILSTLERKTLNFPNLISEYIDSEIDTLKIPLMQNTIKNFLVIGWEIHVMHDIFESKKKEYDRSFISKSEFYKLYHQIIGKSQQQIMEKYFLNSENVETLVPAMLIYEKFLTFTSSDSIYTPAVSLCDGLIRYMADNKYGLENLAFSEKDIIESVKKLGERYSYDSKHADQVKKISLLLFDSSAKLHGYDSKERLLLQIAAIAHDIGKYVNIKEHNLLSHNIIINSDILGLSRNDTKIIANIIKYHSNNIPVIDDVDFKTLDFDKMIMVSKLAAFLKIADALDRSHKQKLSGINIHIGDKGLVITAEANRDSLLEEWEFENKSNLFTDIYGSKPNLIIKRK